MVWNATSISLVEPELDDVFWVTSSGSDDLDYMYNFGATAAQDGSCVDTVINIQQNGSVGSSRLSLLRKVPGRTWPASFGTHFETTSNIGVSAQRFQPVGGFRGSVVRQGRATAGTGSTSITITPAANPMQTPGGLVVVGAHMDSGGAGISEYAGTTGWVAGPAAGLHIVAHFVLPMDRVITPPSITFSSTRGDYWSGMWAYLR
jgi:hypothetical protein